MKHIAAVAAAVLTFAGCKPSEEPKKVEPPRIATPPAPPPAPPAGPGPRMFVTSSGLQFGDIVEGTGPAAADGDKVTVHYTGRLLNGTKFDSSLDRGAPYEFTVGRSAVIRGWHEGIPGMKVGGKRKLVIPPALAYGSENKPKIPPNSTLVFEVELLSIAGR